MTEPGECRPTPTPVPPTPTPFPTIYIPPTPYQPTTVFGGTTTYGSNAGSAYAQGSGLYAGECKGKFLDGTCVEDTAITLFAALDAAAIVNSAVVVAPAAYNAAGYYTIYASLTVNQALTTAAGGTGVVAAGIKYFTSQPGQTTVQKILNGVELAGDTGYLTANIICDTFSVADKQRCAEIQASRADWAGGVTANRAVQANEAIVNSIDKKVNELLFSNDTITIDSWYNSKNNPRNWNVPLQDQLVVNTIKSIYDKKLTQPFEFDNGAWGDKQYEEFWVTSDPYKDLLNRVNTKIDRGVPPEQAVADVLSIIRPDEKNNLIDGLLIPLKNTNNVAQQVTLGRGNCFQNAMIGQCLLRDVGKESQIVVGYGGGSPFIHSALQTEAGIIPYGSEKVVSVDYFNRYTQKAKVFGTYPALNP